MKGGNESKVNMNYGFQRAVMCHKGFVTISFRVAMTFDSMVAKELRSMVHSEMISDILTLTFGF